MSEYKVIYGPDDNDNGIDYDPQSSPKGDFKTVPIRDFFQGAVQHYVYDFGRATRDVSRNEQKDGAASEFDEIKELMSLDSDPEVFDALLSVGMPKPKPEKECPDADAASSQKSSSNTADADDSHEAMTLAECYAMAVHFSFNLNPAITAAVQRIMSGRSNYDRKISGYRNKTLEEYVDLCFGEARADGGLNRHPAGETPHRNKTLEECVKEEALSAAEADRVAAEAKAAADAAAAAASAAGQERVRWDRGPAEFPVISRV